MIFFVFHRASWLHSKETSFPECAEWILQLLFLGGTFPQRKSFCHYISQCQWPKPRRKWERWPEHALVGALGSPTARIRPSSKPTYLAPTFSCSVPPRILLLPSKVWSFHGFKARGIQPQAGASQRTKTALFSGSPCKLHWWLEVCVSS